MAIYPLAAPLLRALQPETAHRLTILALRAGLGGRAATPDDPVLACRVWDRDFANPIGLAAGFDKDAEVMAPLLRLGFGFVEVGTLTPLPQPGNPRPRVFRLASDDAVINRLGFNSKGLEAAARRLVRFRAIWADEGLIGVNLGKNKLSSDAAADYARGAATVAGYADYLVINVSSPNTPGLRALQGAAELSEILGAVRAKLPDRRAEDPPLPVLVKVAPDLTEEDKAAIAEVTSAGQVDGLIVSNTTVTRPQGLKSRHRAEEGGLSGRPLLALSTGVLADLYRLTEGSVPLVGTGGIFSGEDAYRKIRAGASLVQLYTGLIYKGPGLINAIKRDLAGLLHRDGFGSVADAVGADHASN